MVFRHTQVLSPESFSLEVQTDGVSGGEDGEHPAAVGRHGGGGKSGILRGTRLPLYTVLDFISAGNSVAEVLHHYPRLSEAHIQEALKYASDTLKYKEDFFEITA